MKKNLLLCFTVAATLMSAQPVIQTTNFMPIGLSMTLNGAGPVSPGSGGPNQTWDFSSVTATPAGTLTVIDPATTACASTFPTSNWGEMTPGSNPYLFMLRTSGGLEVLGENWSTSCTGGTTYSDTKLALKFPFNYTDTYSDPYVNTNGSYTVTATYDGYGTLITPTGTITNVARVTYNDGGNNYTEWFSTGNPGYPVALSQSSSTIFFSNLIMGVKETKPSSVKVYPNPANGIFTIEAKDQENKEVRLFDMFGKLVLTQEFNGSMQINTSQLSEGIYQLNVNDQSGFHSQKVAVVK